MFACGGNFVGGFVGGCIVADTLLRRFAGDCVVAVLLCFSVAGGGLVVEILLRMR